jgi:integrase/recombinase XerD
VPVSDDALEAIRKWLEIRSEHKYPNDCPVIFCGRDGSYLTDNQVRDYYARASKAAKLKRNVTPHMIRHTVNDRLRRDGVAADVRQKILGHADVRTNANYTAPKFSEGLDAMRRLKLT